MVVEKKKVPTVLGTTTVSMKFRMDYIGCNYCKFMVADPRKRCILQDYTHYITEPNGIDYECPLNFESEE